MVSMMNLSFGIICTSTLTLKLYKRLFDDQKTEISLKKKTESHSAEEDEGRPNCRSEVKEVEKPHFLRRVFS